MPIRQVMLLWLAVIILLAACGGGGGSSSPPINATDVTGDWGGIYTSNAAGAHAITLKLHGSSSVTGNFATGTGIEGTVTGSANGNAISLTMSRTSQNCLGAYSASGTINGNVITFNFSGTDCGGTLSGQGSVSKLGATNSSGWSGNWWADSATGYITFVSLSTTDSLNYSGNIKIINASDSSILTSNISGQYGWGNHPSLCSTSANWMLMPMNNIQGKLSMNDSNVLSASVTFADYSGTLIRLSDWCFQQAGGGKVFSGDWFKKI